MATKQKTVSRVTDLPIINKIWDGMQTVVAHEKQNYIIDISNITGRTILGMNELPSEADGGKNIIYINFNDNKTDKIYVYNGSTGNKGETGIDGVAGDQGEDGYINPNGRGITGTMYIVNNSVTEDPNLPWSAFRGKDMNDKIYELNETFVSDAEFNLLFNDIKYIYAEFVTKEDNKESTIFNNDSNSHIVYKKYWTFEDEGGSNYYILNPVTGKYDLVTVDLWKDIYLGDTEGYFPITSSMVTDGTQVYYYDKEINEYKPVQLVIVQRESADGTTDAYSGDKHIDNYYVPELDASFTADYTSRNNRWSFELNATSIVVPDVYTTEDMVHYTKMSKADVLAIDVTEYKQYYQKVGDEYEIIQNIASYLATKPVRYYKRNVVEDGDDYVAVNNNKYCEVPESEIDMDSLTDDFIILTYTKTTNIYEYERHYPGVLYGEPIQITETVLLNNIDLYYHTTSRKYYENVINENEDGSLSSSYVEIQIPSWIYAEFTTYDEDQISLILNTNNDTQGETENNEVIDNTVEDLDDTVTVERIFRIVPGNKKDLFLKTADERYVQVDLGHDTINSTQEYYIFDGEYIKIEDPETYLNTYDMTIFTGEPQLLPIAIYPTTTRSYVTVEYDPERIKFYENGRIAATIGDDFTTQIIISSENSDAKAYVNVRVTTPVKKIEFATTNVNYVDYGYSAELEYTVTPETADNKEIDWVADDTKVTITPIEEGKIQVDGIGIGQLTITANAADGFGAKQSTRFEVVRPAESVIWDDSNELIKYNPAIHYTDSEVREYNIIHAQEIENGELEPLTTAMIKTPAYYSMVALLYKEYALNPIVSPSDTSYPEMQWTSTNPTIASVYNKNVKVIDTPAVKRIVTQADIDENAKDADGNILTAEQIGTEVTFVKEVSHNTIQYTLTSSNIGEVTITGTLIRYTDLSVSISIRVDQSIEEIVVSPDNLSMIINTKKKLTAEILPDTAVNGTISWHSMNDDIVTVSPEGTITATGLGKTTVIAHAEDGSEVDGRCMVTVTAPAKDINLRADTINGIIYLGIGNTTNISANVLYDVAYASGTKLGINWISTNPEIATISDKSVGTDYKAEITGIALGKTTIIANAKDGSGVLGSIQIEVIKLVESIAFDFEEIEMEVSDSLVLIPRFDPHASNEIVTWHSSDETIAKVKESGIVYALQPGTATITATTTDGTDLSATCTVTIS